MNRLSPQWIKAFSIFFKFKFTALFVLVLSVGYFSEAACPAGWTYYSKLKACQYLSQNVMALSCNAVASSSWSASQTCVKVGNCRASFISKCQNMQAGCRQDIAQKCNNDAACIKKTKCPGQFVVEGVIASETPSNKIVKQDTKTGGGAGGVAKAGATGTGEGYGTGGLGTGEGY